MRLRPSGFEAARLSILKIDIVIVAQRTTMKKRSGGSMDVMLLKNLDGKRLNLTIP